MYRSIMPRWYVSAALSRVCSLEMVTSEDQIIITRHEHNVKRQTSTDVMPCQFPGFWNPGIIPATEQWWKWNCAILRSVASRGWIGPETFALLEGESGAIPFRVHMSLSGCSTIPSIKPERRATVWYRALLLITTNVDKTRDAIKKGHKNCMPGTECVNHLSPGWNVRAKRAWYNQQIIGVYDTAKPGNYPCNSPGLKALRLFYLDVWEHLCWHKGRSSWWEPDQKAPVCCSVFMYNALPSATWCLVIMAVFSGNNSWGIW